MSAEEKNGEAELDTSVSHKLSFGSTLSDPGVAMSETQYLRIQRRIHMEIAKGSATSLWLALAFVFVGFGASAWIALETLDRTKISGRVIGNLQAGAVGAGVAAGLCLAAHVYKWVKERNKGHDICEEMDIYCHRETQSRKASGSAWWRFVRKMVWG